MSTVKDTMRICRTNSLLVESLLVMSIKAFFYVNRSSILFPGDRLLSIDRQDITNLPLSAINQMLNRSGSETLLQIQYATHIHGKCVCMC